ncbi:unnamed protein product [Nesidiocoris tenuis]|uniref:Ubiquitin carboxyl-terminal hydrolase 14 n=1 Tax=Nesidiocoris tenuis TaxID=355587 RepID=A0A6H5FYD8_9HEMI|nr:unnamed protein product [Nesidiocoris tenuis]
MSDADENLAELAKHLPKIRIPTKNDKVFKDESVFSFDTARSSRGSTDPTECFKLRLEDKIECGSSGKVKYTYRTEYSISLFIPQSAAVNQEEVEAFEAKKASGLKVEIGQQPGEELLPELNAPVPEPQLDQAILNVLIEQGFPLEAAKKAVYFTKGAGIEQASNWAMEHITDPDFSDPFVPPGTESAPKPEVTIDPESIAMLASMGFTEAQATKALKATNNNLERAADWIFCHADELDQEVQPMDTSSNDSPPVTSEKFRDGNPVQCRLFVRNEKEKRLVLSARSDSAKRFSACAVFS